MTPRPSGARALQVAGVAIVLFLSLFLFTHQSVIGSEVIPCNGSLMPYCWTQERLGTGLAWVVWHGLFSIGLGWAMVALWDAEQRA